MRGERWEVRGERREVRGEKVRNRGRGGGRRGKGKREGEKPATARWHCTVAASSSVVAFT